MMRRLLISALAVTLLLCGVAIATQTTNLNLNADLWQKYRVALIKILEAKSPSLGKPTQGSTLQIVVEPEEARWHESKYYLNDELVKFPPKWQATWEAVGTTEDSSFPSLYKQAMLKCPNPQAFLKFKNAKTESYPQAPVSYPWFESGVTLASIVQRMKATGSQELIHFIVEERSGQTSINSPWGRSTGPVTHSSGFVKSVIQGSDDDDDTMDMLDEEMEEEDQTQLFFRRRRRHAAPPPKITTIEVKSQRFKVDFKARNIDGVKIAPGPWFDRNTLRANKQLYPQYFGQNGKMPLLPSVVWVAHQPHVVIELSESEWHTYKHTWQNPRTLGMAVGGAFFRTQAFSKRDDDDMSAEDREFYSNDDLKEYHADSASFSVIERVVDDDDSDNDKTQSDFASFTVFERRVDDDVTEEPEADLLTDNAQVDEDKTQLFFRRRRRRRAPPPPPPPPRIITEKVYVAEFKSTDPRPQVIAVTSDILP